MEANHYLSGNLYFFQSCLIYYRRRERRHRGRYFFLGIVFLDFFAAFSAFSRLNLFLPARIIFNRSDQSFLSPSKRTATHTSTHSSQIKILLGAAISLFLVNCDLPQKEQKGEEGKETSFDLQVCGFCELPVAFLALACFGAALSAGLGVFLFKVPGSCISFAMIFYCITIYGKQLLPVLHSLFPSFHYPYSGGVHKRALW